MPPSQPGNAESLPQAVLLLFRKPFRSCNIRTGCMLIVRWQAARHTTMKKCTYCGKEYGDEAIVCALDSEPLEQVTAKPSAENGSPPPGKVGALTEHDGSKCVKCGAIFFSKVDKCSKCQSDVQPTKWYSRPCVERIAFIPILMVLLFILGSLSTDPETPWILSLGVPAFYVIGWQFMGLRFSEKFGEGHLPPDAQATFSWARFFKEGIVFAIIFVVVGVAILSSALWRSSWHRMGH
jgi:hypothetical protein